MKKWKKFVSFILVGAMTIAMTACGSGEQKQEKKEKQGSSDTLTVAIWDTYQEPGIKEILADFTKETGIQTKLEITPWDQYWTMLEAGATGGTLPDVFWMHSNQVVKYAKYDMLLDLSDAIKNSEKVDISKFPKELVELYQNKEGQQIAIPKDVDTVALWYNKKAFDEANLDYPDETWDWDMFRKVAKQLTKKDGTQYGTALNPKNNQETYYNLVYDWGGEIINEDKTRSGWDNEKSIEAMEFIDSIIKDGSMPPYSTMAENDTLALFESGKVAMALFGSWQSDLVNNDYVKENCDLAVLPKKQNTRISIYNGLGWAGAKDGKHIEEAKKLILYLGTEEAQKKQADLGITLSAYEGVSDGYVAKNPNFNLKAYIDMLDHIVIRPYSEDTIVWEDMSIEELVKAWDGKKSMSDVCKEIANNMNAALEKENVQ